MDTWADSVDSLASYLAANEHESLPDDLAYDIEVATDSQVTFVSAALLISMTYKAGRDKLNDLVNRLKVMASELDYRLSDMNSKLISLFTSLHYGPDKVPTQLRMLKLTEKPCPTTWPLAAAGLRSRIVAGQLCRRRRGTSLSLSRPAFSLGRDMHDEYIRQVFPEDTFKIPFLVLKRIVQRQLLLDGCKY